MAIHYWACGPDGCKRKKLEVNASGRELPPNFAQAQKGTVKVDMEGRVTRVKPKGKTWTLEEMQRIVGGFIEIVDLPDGRVMVLNEEGKLKSLASNLIATILYGHADDFIVGDVLITESALIE